MVIRSNGCFKLDPSKNVVRSKKFEIIEDPNFQENNFKLGKETTAIFKANVNYILKADNVPFSTIFKELNKRGIKMTLKAWQFSYSPVPPNLLLVVTFARILGVTPSQLLDPKLPEYYREIEPTEQP